MEKEILKKHQEKILEIYQDTLIPELEKPFHRVLQFSDDYVNETERFLGGMKQLQPKQDKVRILHEHIQYRRNMLRMLNTWISERPKIVPDAILPGFFSAMAQIVEETPRYWHSRQESERFHATEGDGRMIRFMKSIKRLGRFFYNLPVAFSNVFRALLKKERKSSKPWKQDIPARKLTRWYYELEFLSRFNVLNDNVLKVANLLVYDLWKSDDQIYDAFGKYVAEEPEDAQKLFDLWEKTIKDGVAELRRQTHLRIEELPQMLENTAGEADLLFEESLKIAGTAEFWFLRKRKYKGRKVEKKLKKSLSNVMQKRMNTFFALADDWKFNQEIYLLTGNSLKAKLQFRMRLLSRSGAIKEHLIKIPDFIQSMEADIRSDDIREARKKLLQLKYNASKTLQSQVIPELSKVVLEQDFPLLLDETEQSVLKELNNLNAERVLITDFDPSKAYSYKQLQTTSPVILIEFEMGGELKKVFLKSKADTLQEIEILNSRLEDLGRMIIFNFESAIAMLDEQGDAKLDESLREAVDGIQRATGKYRDMLQSFDSFSTKLDEDINKAVSRFASSMKGLTDNRNVEEIRYRLAKARAIKKSRQLVVDSRKALASSSQKVKSIYRLARKRVDAGVQNLRGQLGIRKIAGDISTEISDFLVKTDENLPFVYKRLFIIEPLKESTFYFQRNAEKAKLVEAWQKWQKGAFAPVLIYGEKGSGITTFVHMFVKDNVQRKPAVFSVMPARRILTEEDLMGLLGQSFHGEAFVKSAELFDFIEKSEPFVAFVDKLHLMYLRQPGGFNILKRFFEIISATSRKVFWICTCGLYASSYLDKAIGLYGYFPVLISMRNLASEDIKKVIMLRHKASGYDLFFKPSKSDLTDRSFAKKDDNQQQEYLQQMYFTHLQNHTQSNIAFALQLWIKCAGKTEGNRINILSLDGIDFHFVYNLPAEVIFGLHALILHENLDVFQLSQVLGISRRQAYLLLMRLTDRGIVIEDKGFYSVHPLLYRQTIKLLKDKNMIH